MVAVLHLTQPPWAHSTSICDQTVSFVLISVISTLLVAEITYCTTLFRKQWGPLFKGVDKKMLEAKISTWSTVIGKTLSLLLDVDLTETSAQMVSRVKRTENTTIHCDKMGNNNLLIEYPATKMVVSVSISQMWSCFIRYTNQCDIQFIWFTQ